MGMECFNIPAVLLVDLYSGALQGAAVSTISDRGSIAANKEILAVGINAVSDLHNIALKIFNKIRRNK